MNSLNTTLIRPIAGIGAALTIVVAVLFFVVTNRYVATALENQAVAIVWNAEAVTRLVSYAEDLEWHLVSLRRDVEIVKDIAVIGEDNTVIVATSDQPRVFPEKQRDVSQLLRHEDSRYTYWIPFKPGLNEVMGVQKDLGVVISLDGAVIEKQIRMDALMLLLVSSLGIIAITLVSRGLMRSHVLLPLARIRHRLNEPANRADIPIERDDEIGEVAAGLRAALEQLNDTVSKLETVMENITDGILTVRSDGLILTANRAAIDMLGVARSDDVVLSESVLIDGNPLLDLSAAAHEGLTPCQLCLPQQNVAGEVMVRRMAVIGSDLYTVVIRDVSARLDYEQRLIEAKDRAEHSAKAKSEFLATMSHEIRTPMNGVIGMTQLLLDTPMNEDQRTMARIVQSSAESLLSIINDVLDYSKVESGKLEFESAVFDVRQVIDDVVDLLKARATEKGLTLGIDVALTHSTHRIGDSGRLRQVLLNLVGNAIKFTDTGSVRIVVSEEEIAGLLRFSVVDTGIGISLDNQSRLFESFTQADASTTRKFGGTGLGLAICKRLIELLGGNIGVISAADEGSEFWFTMSLPEAKELIPKVRESTSTTPQLSANSTRVLLVEDNVVNQKVAARILQKFGCTVDVAADGVEAIEMWSQFPYDVIYMDCQMPRMDGYTASGLIRQQERESGRQAIHIVALTANAMAEDRDACLRAGMNDFLSKPITLNLVEASLRSFLEHQSRAQ